VWSDAVFLRSYGLSIDSLLVLPLALHTYPDGSAMAPATGALVRYAHNATVYRTDGGGVLRRVPSEAVFRAWGFDEEQVVELFSGSHDPR
jgi:hypothetical protein